MLVALSAIELCRPEWIADKRSLADCAHEASGKMADEIARLFSEPARIGELQMFRYRYRELASGIRGEGESHAA